MHKAAKIIWLIIIILFLSMEAYHIAKGNYQDLALSLAVVSVFLLGWGIFYLIKKR